MKNSQFKKKYLQVLFDEDQYAVVCRTLIKIKEAI